MISELRVRQLATIEDVTLPLGPGLTVLTGETGAGKSMLVDALLLLLGGRADPEAIRPGAGKAIVEGVFERLGTEAAAAIEALGLDLDEDRLVIRREVAAEGRSRAWINGSPTTAAVLSQIGGWLVDIQGQYDAQLLLRGPTQLDLLDSFAEAHPERNALAQAVLALQDVRARETALMARRDEARRRADYLRHVVEEIDRARVIPGEDEHLEREARRLGSVEQLSRAAGEFLEAVEAEQGGAREAANRAHRALSHLERIDPSVSAWRELLDTVHASLGELARLAQDYAASLEEDPGRLAQVESRRDLLDRLKQKYGATLEAVLETRRSCAAELELLDTAEFDLRTLAAQRHAGEAAVRAAAARLTEKRNAAAERLGRAVNRLLPKLGLAGGAIGVILDPLPEPGSSGAESVQFMARLNPGMDPRPLAKVASGGELSRLMLALRAVLARHDRTPTLVFDEVDQGIGGEIGGRVADTLVEVAGRHQVVVITHLPQIAARADRHLVVSKRARAGMATSEVAWIHGEDRVTELARMLGDADAETARRHATAMLAR
jgi:DNA repair protein RecN (Recombination protein N)